MVPRSPFGIEALAAEVNCRHCASIPKRKGIEHGISGIQKQSHGLTSRCGPSVIDAGSFAGAAREMNQSPAVVTAGGRPSREHWARLDQPHHTRCLALTDIGEVTRAHARHLTEVEEAEALASSAASEPRITCVMLAPPVFVHQLPSTRWPSRTLL